MNYKQLSPEERYTIQALLKSHHKRAEIARILGRAKSTISRELHRNKRPTGYYNPGIAQSYATARRKRCRRKSQFTHEQWTLVLSLLAHGLSPEQISNTLLRFKLFSISHETIYKYLLHDKKHGGSWYKFLRNVPKRRRKRYNSYDSRGKLAGKRPISERPEHINQRLRFGHWEADTVIGKDRHHCILTLVERKSGYVIIKKLTARTTEQVNAACIKAILEHERKIRTITFDNGTEFHSYKTIEKETGITSFFATPYHSWERGTNENTNGLIRQYLPKKSCFKNITQKDCDRIAFTLNTRPRKRHCYKTPEEVYLGRDSALHLMLEPKRLFLYKIICVNFANFYNIFNCNSSFMFNH